MRWGVVLVVVAAALAGGLVVRLRSGPIALPFLDAPIAAALGGLAPGLVAEVGGTGLARAGRGVALQVSGLRLREPDGEVLLSLPALAVRPSLAALVRGRLVIARIDLADAALALTRGADGAWRLGSSGGALAALGAGGAGGAASGQGVPRIHLVRTRLTIDDAQTAGRLVITDGDLLVSVQEGLLTVTVAAGLDLDATLPPMPGRLRLPIRGTVAAPLAADGTLGDLAFTLTGDAGELQLAGDTGKPFPIRELAAEGTWHPAVATLRFASLGAVVGTSRVASKASIILGATANEVPVVGTAGNDAPVVGTPAPGDAGTAAPLVVVDGTVDVLPLAMLTRLWPAHLATTVRTWLTSNLPAGTLRRCRVRLGMHGDGPAPARSPGRGGAPPPPVPPPAYDIACDFDGVTAEYLRPLDPIRAARGAARLTPERLQVDVTAGEVGACRVEGGALTMDLTVDPPRATITAEVTGATAAALALVDRPPLELATPLGLVPADAGGESRVRVELRLPIASDVAASAIAVQAKAALTAASLPHVAGGVGFHDGTLEVTVDGARVGLQGTARLTGLASVTRPVTVALATHPGGRRSERVATLALAGPDLDANGTLTFTDGRLAALTVDRLRLAGSDVAGSVQRQGPARYEASLRGALLDLEALLADPRIAEAGAGDTPVDYALTFDLARVRASGGREIRDLRGTVAGAGARLDAVALAGGLAPQGSFTVAVDRGTDGPRAVRVASDDAGTFLRTFAELQQIVGGTLELEAHTDGRGPARFLDGSLRVRDFKVVRAPVLAKILGIGSLGGIAALLNGDGLPVGKARFPFTWDGERITLRDVRAIGAIGLTADGVFDLRHEAATCDLRGNVIPAYSLNAALGKVPFLGRFLVGGKGQGVFGIDYRVSGKLADPQVRVNPLTSVAPTVLRRWFIEPFTRR